MFFVKKKCDNQIFYWGWPNGGKKLVKILWQVATCQVATWQLPIGNWQLAIANWQLASCNLASCNQKSRKHRKWLEMGSDWSSGAGNHANRVQKNQPKLVVISDWARNTCFAWKKSQKISEILVKISLKFR